MRYEPPQGLLTSLLADIIFVPTWSPLSPIMAICRGLCLVSVPPLSHCSPKKKACYRS